ncbi:cyclodeaminase [Virgibacillus sp. W0430]|uniref:cyclodeaminase n=1 Tax=Virgibacillus sp. W0430 TaxID=3391580 RepID=UPI003F48F585
MLIFTEEEIRKHVTINREAIEVVEGAFTDLETKAVEMPPIIHVNIPENNGEVDVKTAYIPGHDMFALKVSSGFFNNYELGLPSASGLMLLISAKTGQPKALLQDNGYLTDVRTAAAGAVAAKYMAKKTVKTVGVIGAGAQARYQLKALHKVRFFNHVIVFGPTEQRVFDFKREMEEVLDVSVEIAANTERVVRNSDLVITTTPSKEPIVKTEWLHPGLHITAMGSDAKQKQELEAEVLKKADLYVCDVKSQCIALGELRSAVEQGFATADEPVIELGQLTAGKHEGRTNEDEVTIADLTGTGAQDTAIALYAFEKLIASREGKQNL